MSTARNALGASLDSGVLGCILEWFPQSVIVVDAAANVAAMNLRAARLLTRPDGLLIREDVLRCSDVRDTASLHRLITEAATSPGGRMPGRGIRIRRSSGLRALTA